MALQNRVVEEIVAQTNTIPTNFDLYKTFKVRSLKKWSNRQTGQSSKALECGH